MYDKCLPERLNYETFYIYMILKEKKCYEKHCYIERFTMKLEPVDTCH